MIVYLVYHEKPDNTGIIYEFIVKLRCSSTK